jgi:ubiquinone/menaquinone biosynthesis C-methylase UbiE
MTTRRSLEAGQRFLLAAKTWWTSELYQHLRTEYETQAGPAAAGDADVKDVAAILEDLPEYHYFAWFERHLQKMKYSGRYGLARYYDEHRDAVLQDLTGADEAAEILELHPGIDLPRYYTSMDTHQHPGGLWSDEVAGVVYEHGARSTTPMLGSSHASLHTRFTDLVAAGSTPSSVLDMGCGFGKSTEPFYQRFPQARVEAIDLAAPCLRLAASAALTARVSNVHYRQRNAADTGYPAGSFDLVTSTMLLHETPPVALEKVFIEALRVLEPGGRMVHLDFHALPDAFTRFMYYGHGRRNNEPFMQGVAELDLRAMLQRVGFTDVAIEPFREAENIGPERRDVWRLPWTVISGRKPPVAARGAGIQ